MRISIRVRVVLSYLLIIGVGFFYLVKKIADAKEIKPRYMESVEESMVDTAQLLASLVEGELVAGRIEPDRFRDTFRRAATRQFVAHIYAKTKTSIDTGIYLTDAHGIVVFDSDQGRAEGQDFSRWNDVFKTLQGNYGTRSTRRDPDDPTSAVLYVAAPIRIGDQIAGVLTVSKPQRSMAEFMENTRERIIYLGVIASMVVMVVGSIFATWLTRPIQRLTRYAEAVRDGRRVQLPGLGSSEIAALGRTIEGMRDALEGKKYVENYVQTLTHEIKSPVAAIRGAAELLHEPMPEVERERFLGNIQAETIRIQEIVDRLLLLSSVEAKKVLEEQAPVALAPLVREGMAHLENAAEAAEVRLRLEVRDEHACVVLGDAYLLEKAISNLWQNALAFTPPGGRILTEVRVEDTRCILSVSDTGPGIPDFALPRVFERFFSLPRPQSGKKSSGLGLALVREVASLHRGTVTLANVECGGAVATLELPRLIG